MLKIIHPDFIAISIATFSGALLGVIWYSPLLFRKVLLDDLAKNNQDIRGSFIPFIISVFGMFILAIILDTFLFFSGLAGMDPFIAATVIGITISVGIIALNMLSDYMISGTHMKYFAVHTGYRILLTLIMSWILAFL